jgi:hypothetical protein
MTEARSRGWLVVAGLAEVAWLATLAWIAWRN